MFWILQSEKIVNMKIKASSADLYADYVSRMRKIADIKNSSALLQWDQETYLPPKGAGFRGQQIATLAEIAHELFTSPDLGNLLEELNCRDDLGDAGKRNVELSLEDFTRQKKFGPAFVRQLSECVSRSFHSWIEARKANSFAVFEKDLSILLDLKKQEAALAGYSAHPYDALLDEFEKGSTVEKLDKVFAQVRDPLKELLDRILAQGPIDDSFLHKWYPRAKQWELGLELIRDLGFDFEAGRQDLSEHPFTTSFNRDDVRITTRIDEYNLANMTWSCIHETGHALYEQGLPAEYYGLPLGEYASLSIHESQSRLWENNVGRSRSFWKYRFALLQQHFPDPLGKSTPEDFYRAINKVQPSLIRTESDELSYHFHVLIRYELEKGLIGGTISVRDIPAFWEESYIKYLSVKPLDDRTGCLQDVHWSHGSFGYFPTYSLGSFYAAQFFATASTGILASELEAGNTRGLLDWLRNHIHSYGRRFTGEELCRKATGESLNTRYFLDYALAKYENIYKLQGNAS